MSGLCSCKTPCIQIPDSCTCLWKTWAYIFGKGGTLCSSVYSQLLNEHRGGLKSSPPPLAIFWGAMLSQRLLWVHMGSVPRSFPTVHTALMEAQRQLPHCTLAGGTYSQKRCKEEGAWSPTENRLHHHLHMQQAACAPPFPGLPQHGCCSSEPPRPQTSG